MSRIKVKTFNNTEFDFGSKKIKLDKFQYEVIQSPIKGNIRIIACAGSGKTTTILCRVKHLIDNGVDSSRIMLTTFNIDAANTLKERLKNLVKNNKVRIGTFDSICAHFYFKYFKIDGYVGVNEYNNLLIKYLNSEDGKILLGMYDYIFFDEFQDINNEQFQVIKKFYENGTYIIGIGDDAQNIYQWRGSNIDYILNFDKYFIGTVTYKLENNYRSTPEIINLANAIIKNNTDQIEKNMFPNKPNGKLPLINKYRNQTEQAQEIIKEIVSVRKDSNVNPSDIIVISRNNFGLKAFEEQLEIYNKNNSDKIDYIALITDNDKEVKDKNIDNRLVLATIHKIKGCEYEYVFLIDLDDKIFPSDCDDIGIQEERRLLYVAITRAKTFLNMSFCSGKICRFFSEIPPNLFNFPNFKKSYFEIDNKRNYQIKTSVTELITQLKNSDYDYMRSNKIIPDFIPEEDKIHDSNQINDDISKNNLNSDYGIYIDTYISRRFGVLNKESNGLENNLAKCMIYSVELNHFEYALYLEMRLKEYFVMYNFDLPPIIETLQITEKKKEQILYIVYKIINKAKKLNVKTFEIYVTKKGFLPEEFTTKMEESYKLYKSDKDIDLINIYNVSLCPNIYQNRKRLLYKDCFEPFDLNKKIYSDIDIFCKKYYKNEIIVKKNFSCDQRMISGEIDMYDSTLKKLIDFKTSISKGIQMDWIMQLLTYCALMRKEKYIVDYISIYNPISGFEYIIDVKNWNKENELLDLLIKHREPTTIKIIQKNTDQVPIKKYKDKYSTKKIDTNIKKDITLDFLEDEYVEQYYNMKNNNIKMNKKK